MPAPVYSHQLALVNVTTTGSFVTLYTVPAGMVAIVRRFTAVNFNSASAQAIFGLSTGWQMIKPPPTPSGESVDVDTWLVFNPGDPIGFFSFAGPWTVSAHGYLLSQA